MDAETKEPKNIGKNDETGSMYKRYDIDLGPEGGGKLQPLLQTTFRMYPQTTDRAMSGNQSNELAIIIPIGTK